MLWGLRAFALDVLRGAGYHVREAASGDEALGFVNSATPIDLLLTDVVLRGMGGRQVAERFARAYPFGACCSPLDIPTT